jgi:hypothetical protein
MRAQAFADKRLAVMSNGERDRVHAMDMHDDRRRDDRVHAGLDRRSQAAGIQLPIHEVDCRGGAGISIGDRFAQRVQTNRRHNVLGERVGEPRSRRLDPHDAVLFDRRIATRALRSQGIDAERGGELPQRVKLTVIAMRGGHQTGYRVSS